MHDLVTKASLREFFARPEWALLLDHLKDLEQESAAALLASDPSDAVAVARAQTEIKALRYFTRGEVIDALRDNSIEDRSRRL